MAKNLVIVESPAKAATVQKFLNKDTYEVAASVGHVRDLPKKGMSIDIDHGFAPTYEINADKKKVVSELKKKAKAADHVWLASDPDREGEAIAWHLSQALALKPDQTKRVVFREFTQSAVKSAMDSPRAVDEHLVDAQQARRVLDRLVGYELSPILWKKIQTGLSAGRVQSVAVRLIVEREREIENFEAKSSFKVIGLFDADGARLKAELTKKLATEDEARKVLEALANDSFKVTALDQKPATRNPAPPFTTSTLQQEASRKLSFSVRQTMSVAQKLYEQGFITYMRTDSVNLSATAINAALKVIEKEYGKEYAKQRTYTTKTAGAQEAHEAIRPTDFSRQTISGDRNQERLYELIWKRAIATQMAEAKLEKTIVTVSGTPSGSEFKAQAETIQFDGFLKVYMEGRDEEDETEENLLPALKPSQDLPLLEASAKQTYDRPKPRYSEAMLVRKLEEMGIGRPSTYAPTISTIQDRGYVEKADIEGKERSSIELKLTDGKIDRQEVTETYGADRAKLLPTAVAMLVTDFLVKYFPNIVDFDFTAKAEGEFDEIADGKKAWNAMIAEFYGPFHETVVAAEGVSRQEASQARELGTDPKTGKPVIARLGRFGPMVQLGRAEDEEKPVFAALPAGKQLHTVTMEEAMELLSLPRLVGQTEDGQDIQANFGRFGPYIKVGTTFVSIKPDDPFNITLERARELWTEKQSADAAKNINEFPGGVKVLNGRFGPYVTDGKKNAKIPKGTDPASISEQEAKALLTAAKPARPRRRR
ncbi:MAG TPA: type I DNA topoisomerase [Candidatus Saccharimonadales bacterium]|nr:type I DNA topoisomerase [Candidatus Saccharimonadales bacterium]